jgi:Flp pilus assembly pilin Flp
MSASNHLVTAGAVRFKESIKARTRGQTMAEYALILAGVAVVAFTAYEFLGQDINAMVSWRSIDSDLTAL